MRSRDFTTTLCLTGAAVLFLPLFTAMPGWLALVIVAALFEVAYVIHRDGQRRGEQRGERGEIGGVAREESSS